MKWYKTSEVKPIDDSNLLVSWKDSEGKWTQSIRAYYSHDDGHFFSIDVPFLVPIKIDAWCYMPKPEFRE